MHLSENLFQAFVDRELPQHEVTSVTEHLQNCQECSETLQNMKERSEANRRRLDSLAPVESIATPETLWNRIRIRSENPERRRFQLKPAYAAMIAVAALVVSFGFKPVRVWATEFLSLFRVQQIAVVPIDPANLQRLGNNLYQSDGERKLEQLFSDQAKVIKHGARQIVSSANEAGRIAGFGVRLPAALQNASRIDVHPAVDIALTIDVERLQGILEDAGRPDIRIPAEVDGQMVRINIPASVTAFFGKCPDLENRQPDQEPRHRRQDYPDCKVLAQLPSPIVAAPPSLNIAQLGAQMLQLFGMSEEQARKFSDSVDWTTTLVVPLPLDGRKQFSEVAVDGVKGNLFVSRAHPGALAAYNLLWIRDGIVYSLMGQGSTDDALAIVNSM